MQTMSGNIHPLMKSVVWTHEQNFVDDKTDKIPKAYSTDYRGS
jgi:hypothetical protein